MTAREPILLTESLGGVVRSLRGPEPAANASNGTSGSVRALGDVFGRWADAVGDAVARHVQPVKLDGKRLVVEVDDPTWATQLRFLEATVIAQLRTVAHADVEQLEIRVKRR